MVRGLVGAGQGAKLAQVALHLLLLGLLDVVLGGVLQMRLYLGGGKGETWKAINIFQKSVLFNVSIEVVILSYGNA